MIKRKGMFFYCGLSHKQCEILANKHHVYMLPTGRVSLTGINTHNIQRIVQAFKAGN
jgi:aspartate/tyrosine/aromatic aminotransferase